MGDLGLHASVSTKMANGWCGIPKGFEASGIFK